jgi:hypothetical protein
MPGVSSPGLTVRWMSEKSASVYRALRAESHRDEDGISEWVGQRRTAWLRYDEDALE